MNSSRRAIPFLLLALVVLGTALAIGLGLAESPVTNGTAERPGPPPSPHRARPSPAPLRTSAPPCASSSLQLAASAVDAASPVALAQGAVTLLNVSSISCELRGTPVIELVGDNGAVLVSAASAPLEDAVIGTGRSRGAEIEWRNWCGPNLAPVAVAVVLPSAGGTLALPFGDGSTRAPTCTDGSAPSMLVVHGTAGRPFVEQAAAS